MKRSLILTLLMIPSLSFSAEKEQKGLLPELRIDSADENANQRKALQSEVLITKTENQAIASLVNIIKKKKGSPQEPDLWYRLAEMYMRRAKTGRFFDLNRNEEGPVKFVPPEISGESAVSSLKRAVQVYTKIERDFPKFHDMDAVLFNNAFASQQLKLKKNSEALYYKMVSQYPKSPLVPDAYLALGEMSYESHEFKQALEYFKAIEKYPRAKVYSYGMYKSAWTLYNLKQNEDAIQKLVQVIKYHDPNKQDSQLVNHNLRAEALRDLTLFFGETQPADKAYAFFSRIGTEDEVGECIYNLGKLYDSHSRQKEMNVFLSEFIKKQPLSPFRVKMEMLMITGNETARQRPDALKHLVAAASLCKTGSEWRTTNQKIAESECDYDFAKTNVEMAKKWWELWQKNKQATQAREIAEYTQEAFRIHLDREDPKKPDTKSRYAYAELLFQIGNFRKASEQYQIAGTKSVDTQIAHDANYGAMVALERAMEKDKKKQPTDDAELVRLAKYYLERHPKGEHATQVKFKIGFIAYDQGNHEEAEKWLRPLASDEKAGEFKRKSEDLTLDILNARKDYKGIKEFSKQIAGQTKDETRKTALGKIQREADYAEIQEFAKSGEKSKAAEKLLAFYNSNKTSPLAKDSLWQALSLYYADGKVIDGAELALLYAKTYPDDKRSLDALKDAAKHYADSGMILPAAETMELIASVSPKDNEKYVEAASELYLVEGKVKQAQETLKKQLTEKNAAKHGKIYAKILSTMKGQERSAEYQKIEDKIVALNQEPYASEIKIKRIEHLLKVGKSSEAFNASKSLVGSERADDDIRARARLVQAKVLEKEFTDTRTKTSVEKLAVVLSIKTEKLDKAQTAFLTAAKIAKDPNTKLEALQGLNRIYTNYVDSVGHPILKDEASLSPDDKKALYDQLAKLTTPILEKKLDTDKQLQKLAKESKAAGSNEVDFASLPTEETVKPRVKSLPIEQLKVYLPKLGSEGLLTEATRYESGSDKCGLSEADKALDIIQLSHKANACVLSRNAGQTEKIAMQITRKDPKSALGAFYLSLVADMQGQFEKSAWLVDLSLKKSVDVPFLLYQKARALYHQQDFAQANAAFIKAHDLGLKTPETVLMHGVVSFAQGDCFSVMEDFTKLDRSWISKHNLAPAMSECQAQKGEFDKAVAFAEESLKSATSPIDLWLQLGRIQEIYRFDSGKALSAYESAYKMATNGDMKDWLQRKVNFLKGKHTVTVLEPQDVRGKDTDGGHR